MQSLATLSPSRDLSSEASFGASADNFSNVASLSSTPPTTVADDASLVADTPKSDGTAPIGPTDFVSDPVVVDEHPEVADSIVIATTTPAEIDTTCAKPEESSESTRTYTADVVSTTPTSRRSRRTRLSTPVYNLAKLANNASQSKPRAKGYGSDRASASCTPAQNEDTNASAGTSTESVAETPVKDIMHASEPTLRGTKSPKSSSTKKREPSPPRRTVTRASGVEAETLTHKLSNLGKRGRKTFEKGVTRMSRELKRLQDTNEFSGIDTRPVLYTTWANGKYVDPSAPTERPAKRARVQDDSAYDVPEMDEEETVQEPAAKKRRIKKWLDRGLYAGQEAPTNIYKGLTTGEKKKLAQLPELAPSARANKTLPQPMFLGLRMLIEGRDFKLPFDVCNPLPPGQPKPEEWKKITKNRFVGDAAAYWKKTPHFSDYQSKCVCTPEDGCGETCQNRIMLYECDSTNCNVGDKACQNRAFARLQERTKEGGKYRVGVEVIKTSDRGYGIRANRSFKPNQIIMEYTGEIITEDECDRRMNEKYKDNQCYYLMSFDQNMIIDATTGSIARFVNHSCQPNCRMVKWIVSGQPRMALFAGDRDIMTGEELTYDYNFDPFSAKNVQKCLCGSPNCRGVLGPKPKEVKPPKPTKEETAKAAKETPKGGKRKRKDVYDDPEDVEVSAAKRQKIKTPTSTKAGKTVSKTTTSIKRVTKDAATPTATKHSTSTMSINAKVASGKKDKAVATKITNVTKPKPTIKSYGKAKPQAKKMTLGPRATPKKTTPCKISVIGASAEKNKADANMTPKAVKQTIPGSEEKSDGPSPSTRKVLDVPRIRLVNAPRVS